MQEARDEQRAGRKGLVDRKRRKNHRQQRQEQRAEQAADQRAFAADDQHRHQFQRARGADHFRRQKIEEKRVEAARERGQRHADQEGGKFIAHGVDAERGGRHLVGADRLQRPAEAGAHRADETDQDDQIEREHEIIHRARASEGETRDREGGNADETGWPAGDVEKADRTGIDQEPEGERGERIQHAIAAAEAALNGSGRLLVRESGTEPLIRVMAEGEDEALIGRMVDELCEMIAAATRVSEVAD